MCCCAWVTALQLQAQQEPADSFYSLSPVEVRAVRAGEGAPVTRTNLGKAAIAKMNLGQDIPFLLNQTPAVVAYSDAGNGIGYTGIRIRGTDATRINVTLNGIPYNDAESQGTFFVDLPDFSSSAGSIQVQRGVGTSTNGAGAFGASIHFSTNEVNREAYAEFNNSYGSFQTWKNTIRAGTGLHDKFTGDIRLSRISSNGYIDRASSNLQSLYLSTAYIGEKNSLRFNVFTGKEKTYQAWYGVSEQDLRAGNRTVNYAGTEKPGDPYKDETDNYTQTHYQLFFHQQISRKILFNTAVFLTRGKGYYEQYKADRDFSEFGLPYPVNGNDTTYRADFVRQLWLDNYFYGNTFSFQYKEGGNQMTLGGAYTRYDGNHYGKVTWSSAAVITPRKWYDLDARKNDVNIFFKQQRSISPRWSVYYDVQFRNVHYTIGGFRNNPGLSVNKTFRFFNPKAGLVYKKNSIKAYLSYSVAGKEPNRDDFEAGATRQPRPERLFDTELGIEELKNGYQWGINLFHMRYKNQLVLTGQINDVGAYTRSNIPDSYRAGIELQGAGRFTDWFNMSANLALSRNKIRHFTEYLDDYDNGGQKTRTYEDPDIAFSPSVVGSATLNVLPFKRTEFSLLNKCVSRQYLDNTRQANRKLNGFCVNDLRGIYTLAGKKFKEIRIIAQLNNLLNVKYEPNGYSFSYIYGGETVTENFYFPMAGRNYMVALQVRL